MTKTMLKNCLLKLINYYFKIVKLQTNYTGLNLFFTLILMILAFLSIFLNKTIFLHFYNYPNLLNLILYSGLYYSLFLGVNTLTRIFNVLFKGIPFFSIFIKINNKAISYYYGYLIFNTIITIFSVLIIIRLSRFYLEYYGNSFYGFMLYELTMILLLFINHIYHTFTQEKYELNLNEVIKPTILQIFLLLVVPTLGFLCSFTNILSYLNIFDTIHCEPGDGTSNNNVQGNTNTQQSLPSRNNSNLNTQGNDNQQLSSSSDSNINTQSNSNTQSTSVFNRNMGATPFINFEIFSFHRNCNYGNSAEYINYRSNTDSFWGIIEYLRQLRIANFIRPELIDRQYDYVIQKAVNTSLFNAYLFSDAVIGSHTHLYNQLSGYPILFNGIYDVSFLSDPEPYLILSRGYQATSLIDLYNLMKGDIDISVRNKITLMKNIEALIKENTGLELNFSISRSISVQLSKLAIEELRVRNVLINNIDGTLSLPTPIVTSDFQGFKLLLISYTDRVLGVDVKVEKFAIFDSYSQYKLYHLKNISNWKEDWANFVKNPLTNTLLRNDAFFI